MTPVGPAIEVAGVSKTFRVPHEERNHLKEYFVHPLKRVTYEEHHALRDVTFSVEPGEFFGIIGPNGTGKSTLLKLIASIYRPDSGTVTVRGAISPFIELGVGFNYELNARDNILVNGTLMGLTRREIEHRYDEILAFAELERFADHKLKNYSSGMLVRLAYAVSVHVPFDVLLLDEVLAVGDAAFQVKCLATFRDLRASSRTVVLVTHDLSSVASFCDRALYLRGGVPAAIGPPDSVIAAYVSEAFAAA